MLKKNCVSIPPIADEQPATTEIYRDCGGLQVAGSLVDAELLQASPHTASVRTVFTAGTFTCKFFGNAKVSH